MAFNTSMPVRLVSRTTSSDPDAAPCRTTHSRFGGQRNFARSRSSMPGGTSPVTAPPSLATSRINVELRK